MERNRQLKTKTGYCASHAIAYKYTRREELTDGPPYPPLVALLDVMLGRFSGLPRYGNALQLGGLP